MLTSYLTMAIKVLMRRKLYSFITLFGVSFTLVVATTAFAFFENSFLPHPPESDSDRFLIINRFRFTDSKNPGREWSTLPGYKLLDDYMRNLEGISKFSIHAEPEEVVSYKDGRKIPMALKRTDGVFWEITDFRFLEGGPFSHQDEANRNFVAVINQATRKAYFGRGSAVGEILEVDGKRFRVMGVVEDVPEYRRWVYADIWVPHSTAATDAYRENLMGNCFGTVLVADKKDIPVVKASFQNLLGQVVSPRPDRFDTPGSYIDTYLESWARDAFTRSWTNWDPEVNVAPKLGMAAGIIVLFMLLPAINLININVSRIMERTSEIGVRKAFGATSGDLARQFLIENLFLTFLGGVIGFLGTGLVFAFVSRAGYLAHAELRFNPTIFLTGLGFAVFFGLLSGVYPAWRMSRMPPATALSGGGR